MFLLDTVCTNFLDHFFDAKNRITNHRKKEQEMKRFFSPIFLSFIRTKNQTKAKLGIF